MLPISRNKAKKRRGIEATIHKGNLDTFVYFSGLQARDKHRGPGFILYLLYNTMFYVMLLYNVVCNARIDVSAIKRSRAGPGSEKDE